MNGARVIIFAGGRLGDWALSLIRPHDLLIGADRGALFLVRHGVTPDIAIGDFDSVTPDELELIRSASRTFRDCDPVDKDYTDTELAFREALARQPDEIVIAGGLGTRFDHSIANIHLLVAALERGVDAVIEDEFNAVRLAQPRRPLTLTKGRFSQISLLPLTMTVKGITLSGFRYPLRDAELRIGQSLGISNQLAEPSGVIVFREGLLLVIESRDG